MLQPFAVLTKNPISQIASRQCTYFIDSNENVGAGAGQFDCTPGAHVEKRGEIELKDGLQTRSCIAAK